MVLCHVKPVHCWGPPNPSGLHNLHMDEYLHAYHYPLTPLQAEANRTAYYETVIKCSLVSILFKLTEYDMRRMPLLSPLGFAFDDGLCVNTLI